MNDHHRLIHTLAEKLGQQLLAKSWRLATAESCTGGGLSHVITAIPGCSSWFDQGVITYSNRAKTTLLHVPEKLLQTHGAVSQEVACAMAKGALSISKANISVAITGIAGPAGGSFEKPVGTVWIACATTDAVQATHYRFEGDRESIREHAILAALRHLIQQSNAKNI
jgi:nicotinamide-nucleotide amidase